MVPRSHDHWNGDTWKAIVEARTRNDLDTYTCEADHGIGIIFKRDNKQILKLDNTNFKSLKFKDYYYNYNNFMNPIKEKQITDLFQQNSIRLENENTCFAVMYKELKKKNSAMESAAAHYRHSQQGKQANT